MLRAKELFKLPESLPFDSFFDPELPPWQWLPQIKKALASFDFSGSEGMSEFPAGVSVSGDVFVHPSVKFVGPSVIQGPVYIGPGVEIRPNAYIRGNVIVGEKSVLGNSCEYKNCLLMESVESAHFNYVGDSILGNKAHLGAGVICANLRLARDEVYIRLANEKIGTGLHKVGAFIGEEAEVGCNSVLQPGTVLGKRSAVISTSFQGYLPAGKMAFSSTRTRVIDRR